MEAFSQGLTKKHSASSGPTREGSSYGTERKELRKAGCSLDFRRMEAAFSATTDAASQEKGGNFCFGQRRAFHVPLTPKLEGGPGR